MHKIDSLVLIAKKRKNTANPKIVEYLEYWHHAAACEFNGIENDMEPPVGYESWLNEPIEPPALDSPDYPIYQELLNLLEEIDTENHSILTTGDLI